MGKFDPQENQAADDSSAVTNGEINDRGLKPDYGYVDQGDYRTQTQAQHTQQKQTYLSHDSSPFKIVSKAKLLFLADLPCSVA